VPVPPARLAAQDKDPSIRMSEEVDEDDANPVQATLA
jgi:hypothetical protein